MMHLQLDAFANIFVTTWLKKIPKIANWQGYIMQLAFPYKEGYIDGGLFFYECLAKILNINIHLWSFKIGKIKASILSSTKGEKVFDIVEV